MKKSFLSIVCAIALVLGFSSCGGSKSEGENAEAYKPNVEKNIDWSGTETKFPSLSGSLEIVSATPIKIKKMGICQLIGKVTIKKVKEIDSIPSNITLHIQLCDDSGLVMYKTKRDVYYHNTPLNVPIEIKDDFLKMAVGSEQEYVYCIPGPDSLQDDAWWNATEGQYVEGKAANDLLNSIKTIKGEVSLW